MRLKQRNKTKRQQENSEEGWRPQRQQVGSEEGEENQESVGFRRPLELGAEIQAAAILGVAK